LNSPDLSPKKQKTSSTIKRAPTLKVNTTRGGASDFGSNQSPIKRKQTVAALMEIKKEEMKILKRKKQEEKEKLLQERAEWKQDIRAFIRSKKMMTYRQ